MNTRPLHRVFLPANLHQVFVAGLLLFFAGLSVQYAIKAHKDSAKSSKSAFLRWRPQVLALHTGTDIYQRFNYPNAPIMALILSPLSFLPPFWGSMGWFYLKVAMTLAGIFWVIRLVETGERPFPGWAKALMIVLSIRPIMGDLYHGNVNLFIMFLVIGALYAFHKGLNLLAGLSLALGIVCKLTPALFLPYFVWKRAWKTLAGCVLGIGLFLFFIPGLFLGMEHNTHLLGSWYQQMIKPFVVDGEVTTELNNQSIPGLVYRLGTHSPSIITFPDNKPHPAAYHNIWAFDPDSARWFVKGCMIVFAGLVVWTCRTPTDPRSGWRLAAEYSLVALGMLMFSERTWKHHCVTLVLPFGVIAYYLAVCQPGRLLRWYLFGTLVLVMLLMMSTSTSLTFSPASRRADAETVPLSVAKLAQVYGAYVWGYLLLAAAMIVLLRQGNEPARRAGEELV